MLHTAIKNKYLTILVYLQETEEGAEAAIDPGGDVVSCAPPTNQAVDDEGGGPGSLHEAEGEAPAAARLEELEVITVRRLSLQATGGAVDEQEREETKPNEERQSADTEQAITETDGDEGR